VAARLLLVISALALLVLSTSAGGLLGGAIPLGDGAVPAPLSAGAPSAGVVPTGGTTPLSLSPISVSTAPAGLLIDTTNGTAFVESEYGNNLTAISLATGETTAVIQLGDEPYPQALALDPTNWTVWVANSGSGNVSDVSIGGGYVLASVPVGASPDAVLVNPSNKEVYVANGGSSSVSIISPSTAIPTVVSTVPVGPDPDGLAVDTSNHDVFVADAGANNVTVISGKTNAVARTVPVGIEPGGYGAMVYDPATGDIYVVNTASDNVSIIGGTNLTDFASVTVGSGPDAIALDSATGDLFVANRFSDNVTVIVAKNGTVAGSIPVGSQPGLQNGIAINAKAGLVYVANSGSANVSVLSATTLRVVGTVMVQDLPVAVAVDPNGGTVWVANEGSSTVSVFLLAQASFRESGLPNGANWTLSIGTPPVTVTDTVAKGKGLVSLYLANGVFPYSVGLPGGYGFSKVTGSNTPSQHSLTVSGLSVKYKLTFGPIENLTFAESGLPSGALWSVSLQPVGSSGEPAGYNLSTNNASMTFQVVKGAWRWALTTVPSPYVSKSTQGKLHVGTHALTKSLRFKEVVATVIFEEAGLPSGTFWQVNVTGPLSENLSSTGASITFSLPSGTYSFEVWNFTAYNAEPVSGTFTIVAPHHHPYVEAISYLYTGP